MRALPGRGRRAYNALSFWPRADGSHPQSIFGFTSAEAEITRLLMSGLDRQEIADQLTISLNTVRASAKSL